MPRKRILEKQDIIDAGLIIIRTGGVSAFNARRLAEELQTTTSPIFGLYKTLDDLLIDVWDAAMNYCRQYLLGALEQPQFFREFGMRFISLSIEEPHLFRFVFLPNCMKGEQKARCRTEMAEQFSPIRDSIKERFGLDEVESDELMHFMMVFGAGIAMMALSESRKPNRVEISFMMTNCFRAIIEYIRNNKGKVSREAYEKMVAEFDDENNR